MIVGDEEFRLDYKVCVGLDYLNERQGHVNERMLLLERNENEGYPNP